MDRPLYPFTAVVGQERAKQALLCLAVEPRIGGGLLCGEKGTAKSTLVRALGGLEGVRLLELPVSATEDMLLGGVELETAVRTGRRTFQPGLLARADGAVLYADEVNLLPSALTAALLDTLETGVCRMERDGISHTCPARFALVGTMNPEEGTLRPQLLDRFGLYVAVTGERELEARKEVVRRRLAFEETPAAFRAQWARREERLAGQLAAARALLPQVDVGEAEEQAACLLARQANAAGHRAELAILHPARALAALAGRTYINLEDLHTAAELALPHRRREGSEGPPPRQERGEEPPRGSGADGQAGGGDGPADESHPADGPPQEGVQAPAPPTEQGPSRERLEQGENLYEVRTLLTTRADRLARRGSGRRSKTRSATRRGRAVGDRIPRGKAEDLAVGATLRAAAPYQWSRGGGQSGLVILPPDLRVKVRESRVGADIVFAVDASGSMGAARRMKEVKEAVLSMLMDSYQKRDQVGLVAFRGGEAAAVLANADDFIRRLPQGYDTMLTGNGANLSQGQRQLIAIARAAVADPPVMILDEATSSIDTRTEAIVQRGMDSLMTGRTVFVIAHRLSTVRNSDAIMVLDHGRIVERGDHEDLIRQHGLYYQLYTGAFELE